MHASRASKPPRTASKSAWRVSPKLASAASTYGVFVSDCLYGDVCGGTFRSAMVAATSSAVPYPRSGTLWRRSSVAGRLSIRLGSTLFMRTLSAANASQKILVYAARRRGRRPRRRLVGTNQRRALVIEAPCEGRGLLHLRIEAFNMQVPARRNALRALRRSPNERARLETPKCEIACGRQRLERRRSRRGRCGRNGRPGGRRSNTGVSALFSSMGGGANVCFRLSAGSSDELHQRAAVTVVRQSKVPGDVVSEQGQVRRLAAVGDGERSAGQASGLMARQHFSGTVGEAAEVELVVGGEAADRRMEFR